MRGASATGTKIFSSNAMDESQRIFAALSASSTIGFATIDSQLRFQRVNQALAEMNGFSIDAHLGTRVSDLLGESMVEFERMMTELLGSRSRTFTAEVCAQLPTRTERGYWIGTYFKICGRGPAVTQIGAIVVEVTALRKAAQFGKRLARMTGGSGSPFWNAAIELDDAVAQYYAALQVSFSRLAEERGRSEQWLREGAQHLDQRIFSMQKFIDHVVKSLPSEGPPCN